MTDDELNEFKQALCNVDTNHPLLLDWPQCVIQLQRVLHNYLGWLDDFRDGANAEQLASINAAVARAQAMLVDVDADVALQDGHELLNMPTRGNA